MSVSETLLIFVGIPAAIVLLIVGLGYAGRGRGRAPRYRPGRPFEFTPVWFLSTPEQLAEPLPPTRPGDGDLAPALTTGSGEATRRAGVTGGASDRW